MNSLPGFVLLITYAFLHCMNHNLIICKPCPMKCIFEWTKIMEIRGSQIGPKGWMGSTVQHILTIFFPLYSDLCEDAACHEDTVLLDTCETNLCGIADLGCHCLDIALLIDSLTSCHHIQKNHTFSVSQ